jgi:hypothetical protein
MFWNKTGKGLFGTHREGGGLVDCCIFRPATQGDQDFIVEGEELLLFYELCYASFHETTKLKIEN